MAEAADTMQCAADGCERTMRDGVLWRINEKGVPGIFMCGEHKAFVNSWEQRLADTTDPIGVPDE